MMKLSKVKQRSLYFMITHRSSILPCNDYNVQTTIEHRFLQPVTFPHQSGNPVSYHTVAHFFAHADSNTVPSGAVFLHIHYQISVPIGSSESVHILELVILFKTFRKFHLSFPPPERLFARLRKRPHFCDLSRQYFSSFCTSGSKNLSSALRTHSSPEPVNLGPGTLFRLKCHFHGKAPPSLNLSL